MSESRSCYAPETCFAAKCDFFADDDDPGLVGAVVLVQGVGAGRTPVGFGSPREDRQFETMHDLPAAKLSRRSRR